MEDKKDLTKKWEEVLESDGPKLDKYKKWTLAQIFENCKNENAFAIPQLLTEASPGPVNSTAGIQNFDPILISMMRRRLPNLLPFEVAGVQPMNGPTSLIFALRARYNSQTGDEAFYNESNTIFSGLGSAQNTSGFKGNTASDISTNPVANLEANGYTTGVGMSTALAEYLGSDSNTPFPQMGITIEKLTVNATTRALSADYSQEMAQDMKSIHGLDAEAELANILGSEMISAINRQMIRTIYTTAVVGAQYGTTTKGYFDLDTDSNGRWTVERFKGLIFQIEDECNAIARATRRGKGNIIICSSDVASALAMAGVLDYAPAMSADLVVDDTGNTFAGTMHNGRVKVFIDPYFGGDAVNQDLVVVGYKGKDPFDAGLFYCPYVPIQMVKAIDPNTYQPKLGMKSRYGMVANPFAEGLKQGRGELNARSNVYYRIFGVKNLM